VDISSLQRRSRFYSLVAASASGQENTSAVAPLCPSRCVHRHSRLHESCPRNTPELTAARTHGILDMLTSVQQPAIQRLPGQPSARPPRPVLGASSGCNAAYRASVRSRRSPPLRYTRSHPGAEPEFLRHLLPADSVCSTNRLPCRHCLSGTGRGPGALSGHRAATAPSTPTTRH
jgi:hypothetical protein